MEFMGYDAYGIEDILLGITAAVMSIALFLYPMPTMWRILCQRSTADLQPYSYFAFEKAYFVWMVYSLPVQGSTFRFHNYCLCLVTQIGFGFQIFYIYTFKFFTTDYYRSAVHYSGVATVLLFLVVPALLGYRFEYVIDPEKTKVIGPISIIFGLMLYASPLHTIMCAYKTKRQDTLPFGLCILFCLNAVAWSAYTSLYPPTRDYYIAIANVGGIILELFQLYLCRILWVRFQNTGAAGDSDTPLLHETA